MFAFIWCRCCYCCFCFFLCCWCCCCFSLAPLNSLDLRIIIFFLFISLHKFYDQRIHLCFPSSIETRNVRRTVRYFGHSITLKLWLPIYDLLMHFSFHRMNDSSPCRQWLPFRTFHSIKFDRKKRHISTGRAATMWETVDVFFILTFSVRDEQKTMFVFLTRKW